MRIHVVESIKLDEKQKRRLKKLGEVRYFDGLPNADELLKRCEGADIICADWAPIDSAIPRMAQGVRLIAVPFTGVGFLPLKEAADRGIKIANAPGFGTESVGEFGIGLMLSIVRGIHEYKGAQPESELLRAKALSFMHRPQRSYRSALRYLV
jgi:lactate dehydrogenase-like 2-hydroxyacid dehydrogenase